MDTRHTTDLMPHTKNSEIYGNIVDASFLENVRKLGILTPLLITFDNRIISGHRRHEAARVLAMADVPVIVFQSTDELDILEALILSNRDTRQRTPEQEGREFLELKKIAERREGKGKAGRPKQEAKQSGVKSSPISPQQGEARRAGDIAAQQLNIGRQKGEHAAFAVQVMDMLSTNGKTAEAQQVKRQLDKSAHKGYTTAKDLAPLVISPTEPHSVVEKPDKYITLDAWEAMSATEQTALLTSASRKSRDGMNEQKTDKIEWALWSWNPVVGCLTNCDYCYARDIAEKLYPNKFAPAFIPSRLHAPRNTAIPEDAATNIGLKNIFTCSMADLFGRWVPTPWIEAVLSVVRECPQWNFLFLTKYPLRLTEFDFPENAWVGTSVDCQARVPAAEKAFRTVRASVKWLSCEPLLEDVTFRSLSMFQWVVIGGASESTQTPESHPPRAWVNHLWEQADNAGCQVYEKTNLLERRREYPGQADLAPREGRTNEHRPTAD